MEVLGSGECEVVFFSHAHIIVPSILGRRLRDDDMEIEWPSLLQGVTIDTQEAASAFNGLGNDSDCDSSNLIEYKDLWLDALSDASILIKRALKY